MGSKTDVVSWSYPYSTEGGKCTTGLVKVKVEVTFTFLQWHIPADASQDLIDKWNAYVASLQVHEDGHKEIAIQAAHEILQTMEALPAYSAGSWKGQRMLLERAFWVNIASRKSSTTGPQITVQPRAHVSRRPFQVLNRTIAVFCQQPIVKGKIM